MASLKLMPNRRTWYAEIRDATGKRTTINLGIPVRGKKRPASLRGEGDQAFENSRIKAQAELDRTLSELADDRAAIRAQENLARLKSGKKHKVPKLSQLEAMARKQSKGGEVQKQTVSARAGQFATFMFELKGKDVPLTQISVEDIQDFYDDLHDSASVFVRRKGELKRLFTKALPPGVPNPIDSEELITPDRIEADEHHPRKPFTIEQIKRIYEEAEGTALYGPIVAAVATGMRKGDVCTLRWESVFLKRNMIRVRHTRKTKKEIMVPIPPRLRDILKNLLPVGEYVFPEIAELYLSGKSGQHQLRKGLKEILVRALAPEDEPEAPTLKHVPAAEAYVSCIEYIDTLTTTERRKARFRDVARLYLLEGKSYRDIQDLGTASKAQISEALRDMETATGIQLRRNPQDGKTVRVRDMTTEKIEGRLYRNSVYDWHSFRTTFVTQALKAGWSLPDVQAVTGHATVDIVLKHYYDPGEEHLKSLPTPASAAV